jgi:eukaryotic-like serine/threonine-protein kinase
MNADSLPVRLGDVVADKYRVERVLGRGGMGFVVEATHLQLDQKVALKFLLPEVAAHPEVVGRFVREARAAVKVQSEHVARVLDVGSTPSGAPFMVMEYLRGDDLARLVTERGPLPLQDAVGYVLEACEAIAEAHAIGIVHRDLKPANLFLAERPSGRPIVKVLDFGISKLPMSVNDAALTKPTTMMGSPSYMSPEQMVAADTVDRRTDVWALGVVLYELLTAKLPFMADTMPELVGAVLQRRPEPIAALRPDAPPEIQAIIDHCLQKEREARYANVAELAAALVPFGPARSDLSLERILHVLGLPPGSVRAPPRVAQASTAYRPATHPVAEPTFSPTTTHGGTGARGGSRRWIPIAAIAIAAGGIGAFAIARGRSASTPARIEAAPSPADSRATSYPAPSTEPPRTTLAPVPSAVVEPSTAPVHETPPAPDHVPARVEKTAPRAAPAAPAASASAPAGPDCHVVSYFDADGNKHFKKECR